MIVHEWRSAKYSLTQAVNGGRILGDFTVKIVARGLPEEHLADTRQARSARTVRNKEEVS